MLHQGNLNLVKDLNKENAKLKFTWDEGLEEAPLKRRSFRALFASARF